MPTARNRKPGRPKGSATKADTIGKKRARKYFDLTIDNGLRSTAAAKQVAEHFETTIPDVFHAAKRHEPALAREVLAEAIVLERQISEMRAVLEMGPHPLRGRAYCFHIMAEVIKGHAI